MIWGAASQLGSDRPRAPMGALQPPSLSSIMPRPGVQHVPGEGGAPLGRGTELRGEDWGSESDLGHVCFWQPCAHNNVSEGSGAPSPRQHPQLPQDNGFMKGLLCWPHMFTRSAATPSSSDPGRPPAPMAQPGIDQLLLRPSGVQGSETGAGMT